MVVLHFSVYIVLHFSVYIEIQISRWEKKEKAREHEIVRSGSNELYYI